jgi:magnesium chelatase subunit D
MLVRRRAESRARRSSRARSRRGKLAPIGDAHGATIGDATVAGQCRDLSIVGTLRAASPSQVQRGWRQGQKLILRRSDLRTKVRKLPNRHLVVFVVDASRSMGARRRMSETKGAVLSLLVDAYQNRDRVGLVTFGGAGARVDLDPTSSVRRAARALEDLPVGGATPLAHGLAAAARVVIAARRKNSAVAPLVVLLSDGRGNVPLEPGRDPLRDALGVVRTLAGAGVAGLVIDTETGPVRLGHIRTIAEAWGCEHDTLDALRGQRLPEAVRRVILAG